MAQRIPRTGWANLGTTTLAAGAKLAKGGCRTGLTALPDNPTCGGLAPSQGPQPRPHGSLAPVTTTTTRHRPIQDRRNRTPDTICDVRIHHHLDRRRDPFGCHQPASSTCSNRFQTTSGDSTWQLCPRPSMTTAFGSSARISAAVHIGSDAPAASRTRPPAAR